MREWGFPSGSVHLSCFRRPTTRTPRPFLRYSPQTSASRVQVETSKKETSFCISSSCLNWRLHADGELADRRSLGRVGQLGVTHQVAFDQDRIEIVHRRPPREQEARGRRSRRLNGGNPARQSKAGLPVQVKFAYSSVRMPDLEKRISGDWIELREKSNDFYALLDAFGLRRVRAPDRASDRLRLSVEQGIVEYKRHAPRARPRRARDGPLQVPGRGGDGRSRGRPLPPAPHRPRPAAPRRRSSSPWRGPGRRSTTSAWTASR